MLKHLVLSFAPYFKNGKFDKTYKNLDMNRYKIELEIHVHIL